MVHGLDISFPFLSLSSLMATYLLWSAKALKQSWVDKRLYNVKQHDRNIGLYTKSLYCELVKYTEVIVIRT
jgi:hypothetical protein